MSSNPAKPTLTPTNVVWHHSTVTRECREAKNGHRGAIIWLGILTNAYLNQDFQPKNKIKKKMECNHD